MKATSQEVLALRRRAGNMRGCSGPYRLEQAQEVLRVYNPLLDWPPEVLRDVLEAMAVLRRG